MFEPISTVSNVDVLLSAINPENFDIIPPKFLPRDSDNTAGNIVKIYNVFKQHALVFIHFSIFKRALLKGQSAKVINNHRLMLRKTELGRAWSIGVYARGCCSMLPESIHLYSADESRNMYHSSQHTFTNKKDRWNSEKKL